MTVVQCGCGGTVDTSKDSYCESCRYHLWEQRLKLDPDWCWEWLGPSFHRMKCRRKLGHSGECHEHPDNDQCSIERLTNRQFDYERRDDGLLYAIATRTPQADKEEK